MNQKLKTTNFFTSAEKTMSRGAVERAEKKANNILLGLQLAELRKKADIKQNELPGFSQTSISRLEARGENIKLSTLIEYVHALGMEIEIKAIRKTNPAAPKAVVLLRE